LALKTDYKTKTMILVFMLLCFYFKVFFQNFLHTQQVKDVQYGYEISEWSVKKHGDQQRLCEFI